MLHRPSPHLPPPSRDTHSISAGRRTAAAKKGQYHRLHHNRSSVPQIVKQTLCQDPTSHRECAGS
eukprot:405687-Rhodomonas_salina.2